MKLRSLLTASAITIASLTTAATVATPAQAATVTTQVQVQEFFQYLHQLQDTPGTFGYYVDNGTPDAPHFQQVYEGSALQSFLLALQNPDTGCWASVAQGC